MTGPELSIVLGSYNRKRYLKPAIESIRRNGVTMPYEVIVIDGGSDDGSLKWLQKQKDVITIVQHNRGSFRGKAINRRSWGYFMNLGFKCSQGRFVLMMSDDSLLVPGAVTNGLNHFKQLLEQGRKVAGVAFYYQEWPARKDFQVRQHFDDRMMINHGLYLREAVAEVGWIEEESFEFYHADTDLCMKLWAAGYEVVDCPEAHIIHFFHATPRVRRSNETTKEKDYEALLKRWTGVFFDPERKNHGNWKYIDFQDPQRTAGHFPQPEALLLYTVMNIRNAFKLVDQKFRLPESIREPLLRAVRRFMP
jgi:GT2 family glycosyltransferase